MRPLPKPRKYVKGSSPSELSAGATLRTWGNQRCYVDTEGNAFIIVRGSRVQGLEWRRYYGYLVNCVQCGKEVFDRKGPRKIGPFCGARCSKQGHNNPSTQAVIQRGTVAENVLDRLFGKIVRRSGQCAACGKSRPNVVIQCAHGFSRTYRGTRWDESNAWPLCVSCHKFYTHRPIEWENWMRNKLGDEAYQALRMKAMVVTKVDRIEMYQSLQTRLAEIGVDESNPA